MFCLSMGRGEPTGDDRPYEEIIVEIYNVRERGRTASEPRYIGFMFSNFKVNTGARCMVTLNVCRDVDRRAKRLRTVQNERVRDRERNGKTNGNRKFFIKTKERQKNQEKMKREKRCVAEPTKMSITQGIYLANR